MARIAKWRQEIYDKHFPLQIFKEIVADINHRIDTTTDYYELYRSFGDEMSDFAHCDEGMIFLVCISRDVEEEDGNVAELAFNICFTWSDDGIHKGMVQRRAEFFYVMPDNEDGIGEYICTVNTETGAIIDSRQAKYTYDL